MIRVNIGRIVLDGVAVSERERPGLQASIGRELGALLAGGLVGGRQVGGALSSGGAVPAVSAEPLQEQGVKEQGGLASRIARSVYGAISK